MYIMHLCPLSHTHTHTHYIYNTTFVKATFSKSIILKVKSIFEPNVLKWVFKQFSSVQIIFPFYINVKGAITIKRTISSVTFTLFFHVLKS
jgi:hypothetical protein